MITGSVGVGLAVSGRLDGAAGAIALCGVGLLGLSLGTLYQKRFAAGVDVRTGTAVQFLVAAPTVGAGSLLWETPRITDTATFAASLAWLVLVNSLGAFLLLNHLVGRMPANRVGSLFFLTPAVTALLSWLLIGQTLDPLTIAGHGVGAAGVLLAVARNT